MVPQSPSSSPLSLFKSLVTGAVANCRHTHNQSKHIENKVGYIWLYDVICHIWLVVLTILKNMKDSWDDYSHIYGKIKMFETTNQISYPQCPHFCRLTPILVGLECSTHRAGCAGRRTETASSTWGWRWTRNRRCASKRWGRVVIWSADLDRFVYTMIAMIIFNVIIYKYIYI